MIFIDSRGNKVQLSRKTYQLINEWRQDDRSKNEVGGMLVGRQITDSNDIIIDIITLPQKKDKSSRYHFFRDRENAQIIINKYWEESKGVLNYFGEWHTHPENIPHPSLIDFKNWHDIAKSGWYFFRKLLFIIVGIEQISMWQIRVGDSNIEKLKIIK